MPADVSSPGSVRRADAGQSTVRRTAARGNPVSTLVAKLLRRTNVGIGATATAEVSPANAMTCVKPFTIPDKWRETQTPPWTEGDTYDAFDNKGNPLANPDVYVPADQPGYTGYNQETNRSTQLVIRAATGNNITVSFYYSLALGKPVVTGGDEYRWNIGNCNKRSITGRTH